MWWEENLHLEICYFKNLSLDLSKFWIGHKTLNIVNKGKCHEKPEFNLWSSLKLQFDGEKIMLIINLLVTLWLGFPRRDDQEFTRILNKKLNELALIWASFEFISPKNYDKLSKIIPTMKFLLSDMINLRINFYVVNITWCVIKIITTLHDFHTFKNSFICLMGSFSFL